MDKKVFYLMIVALLLLVCMPEKIFFDPDSELEQLNPDDEQIPEISSNLDSIKVLTKYFNSIKESERADIELKLEILSNIIEKITTIDYLLTEEQKNIWGKSQLVWSVFETARSLIDEYSDKIQLNDETEITPVFKNNVPALAEKEIHRIWDNHSILFGNIMFKKRNRSLSILPKKTTEIPVEIRATFLDNRLKKYLEKTGFVNFDDNNVEIFISLNTFYHKSYLNPDKWIIYLEDNKKRKFEYLNYREKKSAPFENIILRNFHSSFIELLRVLEFQQGINRKREVSLFRMKQKMKFYIFSFDNSIIENTEYIKLIFLEEIGSEIKDSGTWYLKNIK